MRLNPSLGRAALCSPSRPVLPAGSATRKGTGGIPTCSLIIPSWQFCPIPPWKWGPRKPGWASSLSCLLILYRHFSEEDHTFPDSCSPSLLPQPPVMLPCSCKLIWLLHCSLWVLHTPFVLLQDHSCPLSQLTSTPTHTCICLPVALLIFLKTRVVTFSWPSCARMLCMQMLRCASMGRWRILWGLYYTCISIENLHI